MAIKRTRLSLLATTAILTLSITPAASQEAPQQSPQREGLSAPQPAPEDGQGIAIGDVRLIPSGRVMRIHSDNIFATPDDERSDWLTATAIGLEAIWTGANHKLDAHAGAIVGLYDDFTTENFTDFSIGLNSLYQVSPNTNLIAGADYNREHEPRESASDVDGSKPTIYSDANVFLGMAQRFEATQLRFGTTIRRMDFESVSSSGGTINNDDRDRTTYEVGGRLSHTVAPGIDPFVQAVVDRRSYDSARDDAGYRRGSEGYRAALGARLTNSTMSAEAFLGHMAQNYDDPRFSTNQSPYAGAVLEGRLDSRTTLTATIDRSILETTVAGSPGVVNTATSLGISRAMGADVVVDGAIRHEISEFEQSNRTDDIVGGEVGVKYYVLPSVHVGGTLRYTRRDSTQNLADYEENTAILQVGASLSERTYTDVPLPPQTPFGRLYVGAFGGLSTLMTQTEGARSGGTILTIDHSNTGPGGGAMIGAGVASGPWYAGLELEEGTSGSSWNLAQTLGRVASMDEDEHTAGAVRLGYILQDNALLYGRLGMARGRFDTDVVFGDGRAFNYEDTVTGIQYGAGIETRTGTSTALRLEYVYTDYSAFSRPVATGSPQQQRPERMDPDVGSIRLGLAYYFGPTKDDNGPALPADSFDGPYVGASLGATESATQVSGVRDVLDPPADAYTSDNGDPSLSGSIFAGYNWTWGSALIGGEVDASLMDSQWTHHLNPGGRWQTESTDWDTSASLRAGWIAADSVLLYGRIGPALTHFDTAISTSQGTQSNTDEWRWGARAGLGAEAQINEQTFVRAEYTQTIYETKSIDWTEGGSTYRDTLDTSLGNFKVSVGYRW